MQALFLKKLYDNLVTAATPGRKHGAEKYLRNQFVFLGVDTTTRRRIFKLHLLTSELPAYKNVDNVIQQMWAMEREIQYCAIELAAKYVTQWEIDFIEIIEKMIVTGSWWDTVDAVSALLCSAYFKKFPAQIKIVTGRWNKSENIWLQRSSILFQLKYKHQTDTVLLARYIMRLATSGEFFVQKAIGWILREYAKTNEAWVVHFVATHVLKPLSRREALKNILNEKNA